MASLNIYIPPNLKKRMAAAGNLGWSRIAQAAFAEAIAAQRPICPTPQNDPDAP